MIEINTSYAYIDNKLYCSNCELDGITWIIHMPLIDNMDYEVVLECSNCRNKVKLYTTGDYGMQIKDMEE
jgi:hypothetical protein